MALTEEQREAVQKPGRIIVSASAGSGKTTVMIRRLVELVKSGKASVKQVLAVTFTKKAAAQMRDKLRNALSEELVGCEDEARKARLNEELQALPLAEISTIHAFCGHLVRTYFYCADEEIQPDFKILTPDEAKSLSLRAMNEVFERAYEERNEDFRLLLAAYYKKNDAFLRNIIRGFYDEVRGYANYREILLNAGADSFDAAARYLAESYRAQAISCFRKLEELRVYFEKHYPAALKLCDSLLDAAEYLRDADGLFRMKEYAFVSMPLPGTKKPDEEAKRKTKALGKLNEKIKGLFASLGQIGSEEIERARAADAARRAAAVANFALEYDKAYSACKREAGALDYDDLEHFAYGLLGREEVRREVRRRFCYVFVDEYQDVNPMQEAIIGRLAGENLFLVGDDKQAIYGFRGSKSKFFIRTEKEYAEHGNALRIGENFRSARGILQAVNRVFGSCIEGYVPMRGGDRFKEYDGIVSSYLVKKEKKEEKRETGVYSVRKSVRAKEHDALAEKVLALIRGVRGKEWYNPDANDGRGGLETIGYGDIAVLVRAKAGIAERVVALLSEQGVPVTTSANVNVCAFFEARLLIDWLSFLDNAEQDIPLAGAMLSRIGGFTDDELALIRLGAEGGDFRAAVKNHRGELKEKIDAFFKKAARLRALSQVRTAAETMNGLLSEGLEVQIALKPDGKNRLARVRRLVAEGEGMSVHDFLRSLREREEKIDFCESGGKDAVKVMTMHASKGLEFPVVILASLSTAATKTDSSEVMFADDISMGGEKELPLIAPKCFDERTRTVYETLPRRAAAAYNQREEEEGERNLLYVAMTRAQYRLCLVFEEESANSKRKNLRYADFFDESFYPAEEEEDRAESVGKQEADGEQNVYSAEALRRACLAEDAYRNKYGDGRRLPMKSSATALIRAAAEELVIPYPEEEELAPSSVDEGLAYHAFLQFVRFGASAGEELARMKREGVLPEKYLALLNEEKLTKILSLPCIQNIADKPKRREQKFLVSVPAKEISVYRTQMEDEIVFQGAIDLLYSDENGYTVVDYKYSALAADALKAKYAPQIQLYRKAVAKALRVDEEGVRASIVNIRRLEEIPF